MATLSVSTTDTAWTALGGTISTCVLQMRGDHYAHIGSVAPLDASLIGFKIKSGEPTELPGITALGGKVWVRSILGVGAVVYAVA